VAAWAAWTFEANSLKGAQRRDFNARRWFVPLVPLAPNDAYPSPVAPGALAIGPINRSTEEERRVQVLVRDNNVDQALKVLKKKMQREGVFREMKLRAARGSAADEASGSPWCGRRTKRPAARAPLLISEQPSRHPQPKP
jgi:hypothetical protein